jgi:protein SCO1/2
MVFVLLAAGPRPSSLADIGPAPPTILINSAGKRFDLASLRGKVALISFVYTTCNGTCPATTASMVRIQKALERANLWGTSVEFVSITLDPRRDSTESLGRYAQLYGADSPAWQFLTGPPARVDSVILSWGMWAKRDATGVIDHPSRVFLLDTKGREREIYNLEFLNPATVVQDVRGLLNEIAL